MKLFLFLIFAGYAVRCDDSNSYYVIQMPEDPPKTLKKPFRVYWNVPTMQCASKKIPFENLNEKYGIIQNDKDRFRGEKIAILYDPGLFPALLKNETSGEFKFRNGGVPQEGDLDTHLDSFRNVLEQSVPDKKFNGVGIIDFESWRPVFRQNFGVLVPYKDISYQLERSKHWWWPETWVKAEAKNRFEEAARKFMQKTISLAKQMRPEALWGYYGFPYCFNMATNNMVEDCSDKVKAENDGTAWLWSSSTALYPSVYSSRSLSPGQLAALVRGRVREAARAGAPVLPYWWFRYRDGGYMSEIDLKTALQTLYKSDASGFIIWGSSKDVNTAEKCVKLLNYVDKVLGPMIARYTKDISIKLQPTDVIDSYLPNETSLNDSITTVKPLNDTIVNDVISTSQNPILNSTVKNVTLDEDPEFYWDPPVNYTQDIVKYVDEFNKNGGNFDVNDNETQAVINKLNDSVLIDMILYTILGKLQNKSDIIQETLMMNNTYEKNHNVSTEAISTTSLPRPTELIDYYDLENSTYLENDGFKYTTVSPNEETSLYTDNYTEATFTENDKDSTGSDELGNHNQFYNQDTFSNYEEDYSYESISIPVMTTELSTNLSYIHDETTSATTEDNSNYIPGTSFNKAKETFTGSHKETKDSIILSVTEASKYTTEKLDAKAERKEILNRKPKSAIDVVNTLYSDSQVSTTSSDQVYGSAPASIRPKYYICIFFYFYSVTKCLCDIYGQCS